MKKERKYIAIDLKSFYASVECIERGRDPLTTNLVVADQSRTDKTICLAVSSALKAYGIPGRPRLFEVKQKIKEVNAVRRISAPGKKFTGKSDDDLELKKSHSLEVDFIAATPRMAYYMDYSARIYNIYLKYIAPEDIHVYSIDEVFMDVTDYLKTYNMTAHELAITIIKDVLKNTGITATAGIGTNMYLCKIAMDIVAKHIDADEDGVRIAELDEITYRKKLWDHRPLIDFWRVGKGYCKKLEKQGLFTMGDIARCSIGKHDEYYNEDLLYKMFGVNAELLIDHAWGYEPCTMEDIKKYKPESKSIGSGQVLQSPYPFEKAKIVTREMTDALILDLVDKGFLTEQIVLTVGYDRTNLTDKSIRKNYNGRIRIDHYGREVPYHAHGTVNFNKPTSSSLIIVDKVMELFDKIVDENLLVRRISIAACKVIKEEKSKTKEVEEEQISMFSGSNSYDEEKLENEKNMQQTLIDIKKKFGKNMVLKGTSLQQGSTAKERNNQIGGHKA